MKRLLTPIITLALAAGIGLGMADNAKAPVEAPVSRSYGLPAVLKASPRGLAHKPAESLSDRLTAFSHHIRYGERFGYIDAPRLGLHHWLIREGTTERLLDQGPGHYLGTSVPGAGGTVAIAGHDVTPVAPLPYGPFHWLNRMRPGDTVTIHMSYGTFKYTYHRHTIIDPTDTQVDKYIGHERLVLSECWPRYTALHRWVVILWPVR